MATTRWRSSLANIETRLRRSLGIAGPIGLDLTDPLPMVPVVIADDARRPGSQPFRGRRFAWLGHVENVTNMTGYTHGMRCIAPTGVIMREIYVSPDAMAHFNVLQYAPGAATVTYMAAATPAMPWIESPLSAVDFAPIATADGAEAGSAAQIAGLGPLAMPDDNIWHFNLDFYVPFGGILLAGPQETTLDGVSYSFTAYGEVY